MPPAVNRSALALYAHRLVEDGCRFRLHASPGSSPDLKARIKGLRCKAKGVSIAQPAAL